MKVVNGRNTSVQLVFNRREVRDANETRHNCILGRGADYICLPDGRCLFHGTERHGTERNAGLFHGTDKCDRGTINLILEYLTRNSLIRICKVRNDKLYY